MNIQELAEKAHPFIEAIRAGKQVELFDKGWQNWQSVSSLNHLLDHIAMGRELRIRPEAKFRPWKPEEVPVGAVVRLKTDHARRQLIVAVGTDAVYLGRSGSIFDDEVGAWTCSNCEYSTDGEKTWHQCGVLEEQPQ